MYHYLEWKVQQQIQQRDVDIVPIKYLSDAHIYNQQKSTVQKVEPTTGTSNCYHFGQCIFEMCAGAWHMRTNGASSEWPSSAKSPK